MGTTHTETTTGRSGSNLRQRRRTSTGFTERILATVDRDPQRAYEPAGPALNDARLRGARVLTLCPYNLQRNPSLVLNISGPRKGQQLVGNQVHARPRNSLDLVAMLCDSVRAAGLSEAAISRQLTGGLSLTKHVEDTAGRLLVQRGAEVAGRIIDWVELRRLAGQEAEGGRGR